jgi:release factor glutamine methyltransferase
VSAALPVSFSGDQPADSALATLRRSLAENGAESAALEARCLVEAASGLDRAGVIAKGARPLGSEAAMRLNAFAARRLAGEPLARILGTREFWGLPFGLSAATLEPRPETETLVAAALRHCAKSSDRDRPWRILDLGTGSGCILVSLLKELPNATGFGVDRSRLALATASRNAERLGVAGRAFWVAGDWASAISCAFDIVVSNPPYVTTSDIATLACEVREHDPVLALDGGPDGLACYRSIVKALPRLLAPGGRAFLEIGAGQGPALRALLAAEGLAELDSHRDLAAIERVVSVARVNVPLDPARAAPQINHLGGE